MPTNPPFPAVTIKANFQTGDKPTQAQFATFIDGVAAIDANSPLNNFAATSNPAVIDDANDGYSVGSRWVNITTDNIYQCVDATVGAAIWQLQSSTSLPSQTGNSGKFLSTDGTNAQWSLNLPSQAGNSGKVLTTDGTNASWGANQRGIAKAWVSFTGSTGVILSSYGVSSVTRSVAGDYTINWSSAFANSNYVVTGIATDDGNVPVISVQGDGTNQTTTSCRILVNNGVGGLIDRTKVYIVAHGD
jgi:hypothetical protein